MTGCKNCWPRRCAGARQPPVEFWKRSATSFMATELILAPLKCRRRLQQHHQHARHGGLTIIVILLSPSLAKRFGKEGRRHRRLRVWRPSARSRFIFLSRRIAGEWSAITIVHLHRLCADDSADLGDFRRRGRLFRIENRPPFHGHGFCHHRFRVEIRAGAGLGFVPLDHGRLFPLRHQTARRAGRRAGYRATLSIVVGLMFTACTILSFIYGLNKGATIEMADELAVRRLKKDNYAKT